MLWNPDYSGKVGIIDDAGEALAMAMLAWGITEDINTTNAEFVNAGKEKLDELTPLGVKVGVTEYRTIAENKVTANQAWSGDLIAARRYLPNDDTTEVLGYWVPDDKSERVIGNDNIAIPKSSPSPVLAHAFLDYMLDNAVSEKNFNWNGYQPPLNKLDAPYLIKQGYISDNLMSTVVLRDDFVDGKQFYEQTPQVQNMWLAAFQEFQSGGS
jgi:spermidine/putrescine-binding protein